MKIELDLSDEDMSKITLQELKQLKEIIMGDTGWGEWYETEEDVAAIDRIIGFYHVEA